MNEFTVFYISVSTGRSSFNLIAHYQL